MDDEFESKSDTPPKDVETRAQDTLDQMGLAQPAGDSPPITERKRKLFGVQRPAARGPTPERPVTRAEVAALVRHRPTEPAPEFVAIESMVTKVAGMMGVQAQSLHQTEIEKAKINAKLLDTRAKETHTLNLVWRCHAQSRRRAA